jgi:single stranded DNA-binding protein
LSLKVQGECFISRMDHKFTSGGTPFTRFSIKTSRKNKQTDQWENEWFNGVCWRDLAETVATYADGQKVKIEGILSSRQYEKDGQKRTAQEIVVFQCEPVGELKDRGATKELGLNDESIPF